MKQTAIKACRSDRVTDGVIYALLALLLLVVAYPLYFVVIASFSDPVQVSLGNVSIVPRGFTLEGYQKVFEYEYLLTGYRNTLLYTVSQTVVTTMLTLMAGFSLSRKDLMGRGIIMKYLTFTMFFSGGMVPTYLQISNMNLIGKPVVLILVGLVGVYHVIISRTFMEANIPEDLYEAASIDGCGIFRFFFQMALPLSQALIAVLVLFIAVGQWNSWFGSMIYLRDDNQRPLQYFLRKLLTSTEQLMQATDMDTFGDHYNQNEALAQSMKYGIIIVATAPILCLYPFIQKFFVKGMMVGSIKG